MGESGARNTAIALSLAVHGAMFWAYGDRFWQRHDPAMASRPIMARLSLAEPKPAAPQLQASMPAKPQAESPVPNVAPQPKALQPSQVVKAEPAMESMAEPVQPEPDSADVAEAGAVQSTEPQQEAPAVEVVSSEQALTAVAEEDEERSAEELRQYLAALQAAIARHKEYPAMARRRGIEGQVEVSFMLLADGNALDIQVSGGPRPLRRAAHKAVHRSLRFPPPPPGTPTPLPVQYAMNFSLR
jgi:protein TonB